MKKIINKDEHSKAKYYPSSFNKQFESLKQAEEYTRKVMQQKNPVGFREWERIRKAELEMFGVYDKNREQRRRKNK